MSNTPPIRRNLNAIAALRDGELQEQLIVAMGAELELLQAEHPECFQAADQVGLPINVDVFLDFVALCTNAAQVQALVEDLASTPAGKVVELVGFCVGRYDGVSYSVDAKQPNGGKGVSFYRCHTTALGGEIQIDGSAWTVLWNGYKTGGTAGFDHQHTLIIAPISAFTGTERFGDPILEPASV